MTTLCENCGATIPDGATECASCTMTGEPGIVNQHPLPSEEGMMSSGPMAAADAVARLGESDLSGFKGSSRRSLLISFVTIVVIVVVVVAWFVHAASQHPRGMEGHRSTPKIAVTATVPTGVDA